MAKTETSDFVVPPRLPLGDRFSGECRARGDSWLPMEPLLTSHCNTGYGRGVCERFPADARVDAVRFNLAALDDGLRIQFVLERECWPAGHGILEYSNTVHGFVQTHEDPVLQKQAEAFVQCFLRRNENNGI